MAVLLTNSGLRPAFLLLLVLLAATLAAASPVSSRRARHIAAAADLDEAYDYIIIGGGTAGLTIADRLTEPDEFSVLVIENGDFYNADDPRDHRAWRQYNITSLPQEGMNNRTVLVSMGHCVGGSSAINGMAVMRGTEREYDIWAELGNEGSTWGWDGMLPYFRKAIHFVPPDPDFAKDYNITFDIDAAWGQYEDTEVYAAYPGGLDPRIKTPYNALKDIPGVEFPADGHAGSHGVFFYPVSVDPADDWKRSYARTGHWDNLSRGNYNLLTGSRVTKVLFADERDDVDVKAEGVRFLFNGNGEEYAVGARKEIVLSAGAIHSPHVLQLSGIGQESVLAAAGIETIVDLPGVGANFQDHPVGAGVYFSYDEPPPVESSKYSYYQTGSPAQGQGLVAFLSLPVAAPEDFEAIASSYESLDLSTFAPDSAADVLSGYRAQQKIFSREMRSKQVSFLNYIISPAAGGTPINLHITSRGTIRINASNPEGDPVVDYRALSNPTDVDLMIAYINFLRRLFTTGALAQYNATEIRPGSDVTSKEDLEAYVRSAYSPQGWHPVGTAAKMRRDLGGVVDDELKVYGVKNLRVADASIMPTLIGGTTQLTVYAIAEKASEMIKKTWTEGD